MTHWHPELAIVGAGCAHVYLVPDNGSLSRIHTVEWDPATPNPTQQRDDTANALFILFRHCDVVPVHDLRDVAANLWARLDRRNTPK